MEPQFGRPFSSPAPACEQGFTRWWCRRASGAKESSAPGQVGKGWKLASPDPGVRTAGPETPGCAPWAWRPRCPESPILALALCPPPHPPAGAGQAIWAPSEPRTRPRGQILRPGGGGWWWECRARARGPPGGVGGGAGGGATSFLGRGGTAQGIKAARAGDQASFGVVLGRVLFPEPHDRAKAAASLSTKRLSVQCSSRRI